MTDDMEQLKAENEQLKAELDRMKEARSHAGRPKIPDDKIQKLKQMIDDGCKESEILRELGIGRNTYYRYKRELKEGGL